MENALQEDRTHYSCEGEVDTLEFGNSKLLEHKTLKRIRSQG